MLLLAMRFYLQAVSLVSRVIVTFSLAGYRVSYRIGHSTKLSLNAFLIAVEGSSLYSIVQRVFHRHIDDRENANT